MTRLFVAVYRGADMWFEKSNSTWSERGARAGNLPERVICDRTLGIRTVSKYVHKTYVRHERCDAIENRAEANILWAWIMQALQMHHPLKFHQNSDKSAAALEHTSRPSAGSITRSIFFFNMEDVKGHIYRFELLKLIYFCRKTDGNQCFWHHRCSWWIFR